MNPAPVKPQISIEDLEKVDIRVGTIEAVADVHESEKLVRLRVSFGDHVRTILAGMKRERERAEGARGPTGAFRGQLDPATHGRRSLRRHAARHWIRRWHRASAGRARDTRPGRLPSWMMRDHSTGRFRVARKPA